MEKIFSYITKNFITVAGITILTGTTLTTSAIGVMKVANNFERSNLEVPEVKGIETSISSEISPTPSTSPQTISGTRVIPHPKGTTTVQTNTGTATIDPTIPPTTSSSTTQSSTTSTSQCVVTLSGNKYDVTSLRTTHSGGNIFNCGTDMTAVYQGRHGTSLSRMQKYLISTTSTSGGTTSNNANNSSSSQTNTGGGNQSSSSSGGSSTSNNQEQTPPQNIENHKEEHKEEEKIEIHKDEDHQEEEETHLESFFKNVLKLIVS